MVADGGVGAGISNVRVLHNRLCAASIPDPNYHPIAPPGAWVTAEVGNCCDCIVARPHGSISVSASVCASAECNVTITWTTAGLVSPVRVCVEAPWSIPTTIPTQASTVPAAEFGRCWNSSLTGASGSSTLMVRSDRVFELWAEELAWPLDVAAVPPAVGLQR